MSTRVAIGMPVYNGSKWIEATVDTMLTQTCADFELVLCDNASTDETERICRAIAARDARVRYHRNAENIGVARNFTTAFRLAIAAGAPYFKWLCNGDATEASFLERCVETLDRRPDAVLVYPSTRLFEQEPRSGVECPDSFDLDVADPVARFKTYLTQVRLNNIMHGVYRSEALARTRLYRPFLGADVNMIAELLLHGRVVRLPQVLNFRRMHPETMSKLFDAAALRAMYAPKSPTALRYQSWAATLDYFGAPLRAAGLGIAERLRLLAFVSRLAVWRRSELMHELVHSGRSAA